MGPFTDANVNLTFITVLGLFGLALLITYLALKWFGEPNNKEQRK